MKRLKNWILTTLIGTLLGFLAERFVFGKQAQEQIISLKAELNAVRGQLETERRKTAAQSAEADQLRAQISSLEAAHQTIVEMLPAEDGVETNEAFVSDDLDVQSAESEGMVMLPEQDEDETDVEELPEDEGVETDEDFVSDDVEVQSAESEGMVMLPEEEDQPKREDNLQRIEGIGPKFEAALVAAGMTSYEKLADADAKQLGDIIVEAGMRRPVTETWAEQATLAALEDWDGLKEFQDQLVGGRRLS